VVLAVWVVAFRGGHPIVGFPPPIPGWAAMVVAALTIGLALAAMGWYATRVDEA
jgi:hypothetical protein